MLNAVACSAETSLKTSASSSKIKMMSQEITLCKLLAREVIPMDTKPNSTLFTVSAVCVLFT